MESVTGDPSQNFQAKANCLFPVSHRLFSGVSMGTVMKLLILPACIFLIAPFSQRGAGPVRAETTKTSEGPLQITFLGHASLKMDFHGRNIYIDPSSEVADFSKMPKADMILFTHEHSDHFDLKALEDLKSKDTLVVLTEICAAKYGEGIVMKNEDVKIIQGLKIEGVPAYNIVNKRPSGFPYHLKGVETVT